MVVDFEWRIEGMMQAGKNLEDYCELIEKNQQEDCGKEVRKRHGMDLKRMASNLLHGENGKKLVED